MKLVCALLAGLALCCACHAQNELVNLALNAPYTLSPAPNYGLCTDPGDATQLTDGVYSEGYFWTQTGTVGWSGRTLIFINVDLGKVQPICGLSYNAAAGAAQVEWPQRILIYVSDDGVAWHQIGDLMDMIPGDLLPAPEIYGVRKLATTGLKTHGRYVQLAVMPRGAYSFVDEMEVYKGTDDMLQAALPGEAVPDVAMNLKSFGFNTLIQEQLGLDLDAARADLAAGLTQAQREALGAKAEALTARLGKMPPVPMAGFKAILPMTDLEKEIYAFQAEVWRAQGKPPLRVWQAHRWEYLGPSDEPAGEAAPRVAVRMMNGETRAEVVNFTNAGAQALKLRLRLTGLPGGTDPKYAVLREVLHTGTRRFVSVAAALPEMKKDGEYALLTVEPGMTRQVWVEFSPQDLEAGKHEGTLEVAGLPQGGTAPGTPVVVAFGIPVTLDISAVKFPEQTSLLVGGWDYTDSPSQYGVKPGNRAALIQYLKEHRVNMPWGTSAVMPEGAYNADGTLAIAPDTARFDEWVHNWEGAKLYMVFVAKGDAGGAFTG